MRRVSRFDRTGYDWTMPTHHDDLPAAFSVAELAAYDKISRTECLRRIHNGAYPGIERIGNQLVISQRGMQVVLARSLPRGDVRRDVQDEVDAIAAADVAERQRVDREAEADRKKRMSAAGQRATAARLKKERDAADKDFGTAASRITVFNPLRKTERGRQNIHPISDRAVEVSDLVGADPNLGKVPGARVAFVVDPKKVKEFTGKVMDSIAEEANR